MTYTVEEVQALAKYLQDATPNWYRESFGDFKSSAHTCDNAPKNATAVLLEHADLLEQIERVKAGVTDGTKDWQRNCPDYPNCPNLHCPCEATAEPVTQSAAVAWMTHQDEPMLFLDRTEAASYCEDDEQPIPLNVAAHPRVPDRWTRAEAKLHERKTVHEWLNELHIEREEFGKPLCLLRRLRILCDRYADTCEQVSFEIRKQIGWISTAVSQPARNTPAIYWHTSPHGGFVAIADEWRDEHHLAHASHWLPYAAPQPKESQE